MIGTPLDKPYFADLGVQGIAWVRECLGDWPEFAKLVSLNANLDSGKSFIAIAVEEHKEALANNHDFKWIVNDSSTIGSGPLLLDKLREIEMEKGSLVIVGEDNVVQNGNLINPMNLPFYQFGNSYFLIQKVSDIKKASDFDVLDLTVGPRDSTAYVIPEKELPNKKTLGKSDAVNLASSVTGIINSVYHGETYTIWVKN